MGKISSFLLLPWLKGGGLRHENSLKIPNPMVPGTIGFLDPYRSRRGTSVPQVSRRVLQSSHGTSVPQGPWSFPGPSWPFRTLQNRGPVRGPGHLTDPWKRDLNVPLPWGVCVRTRGTRREITNLFFKNLWTQK